MERYGTGNENAMCEQNYLFKERQEKDTLEKPFSPVSFMFFLTT